MLCVCVCARARVMGALLVLSRRTSGPPFHLGEFTHQQTLLCGSGCGSAVLRVVFTRLSSNETELSRNLQLRWNLSLFMALRSRTGFYRQEANRTVWEVPERYRDLKQIGTGAYGTVW